MQRFYKRGRHPPTEGVYHASLVYMENCRTESRKDSLGLETPRPDYELCIWAAMQYAAFLQQIAETLVLIAKSKPRGVDLSKLVESAFIDFLHAYKWYVDKALVDATAAQYYRHVASIHLAVAGLNYAVMQLILDHHELLGKIMAVRLKSANSPNATRNAFREFILALKDWLDYAVSGDNHKVYPQRVHKLLVTTNLDKAVSICPEGYKPIMQKAVAEARAKYSEYHNPEYQRALRI